jgi:hypothetical protein
VVAVRSLTIAAVYQDLMQVVMPDTPLDEVFLRLAANAVAKAIIEDVRTPVLRPAPPSWLDRPSRAPGSTLVADLARLEKNYASSAKVHAELELRLSKATTPEEKHALSSRVQHRRAIVEDWRIQCDRCRRDLATLDADPRVPAGGNYLAVVAPVRIECKDGNVIRNRRRFEFQPTPTEWEALTPWRHGGSTQLPYTLRTEGRLMLRGQPEVASVMRAIAYRSALD